MKAMIHFLREMKQAVVAHVTKRKNYKWVTIDKDVITKQLSELGGDWAFGPDYYCIGDKTINTGFDRHYVYHPAWAMRILINQIKPEKHVDISSTLHFCSMLSAIMPVDFYDYRPADLSLSGLNSFKGDLNKLPFQSQSLASISCMHTVEHIGLGRYGDVVDIEGDKKAMSELQRVVAPGGSLLFVTPVADTNTIYFNAHRVYRPEHIAACFSELTLKEFYYIPGHEGAPKIIPADSSKIKNEKYGCGCFWFTRAAM